MTKRVDSDDEAEAAPEGGEHHARRKGKGGGGLGRPQEAYVAFAFAAADLLMEADHSGRIIFAIGASGMVMWFPQFFTAFLPGWVINIALIVHSDEALLAAGFIFTVHFFNTHFRLEKFPMDNVIFSGRISKTEMLHERKRWYERLVATGKLDQYRVRDEWDRWKKIARPIGFVFFGIGLVLLVLIIYAMVTRLAH